MDSRELKFLSLYDMTNDTISSWSYLFNKVVDLWVIPWDNYGRTVAGQFIFSLFILTVKIYLEEKSVPETGKNHDRGFLQFGVKIIYWRAKLSY
jgi:hypothetical protein